MSEGNNKFGGQTVFQFERLDVWKKSIDWADEMMVLTEKIPQQYQVSLGEQIRSAALRVPTNIIEGTGRKEEKEKKYFYNVAKGSVDEVENLLLICVKRKIINDEDEEYRSCHEEAHQIGAMLTGLLHSTRVGKE